MRHGITNFWTDANPEQGWDYEYRRMWILKLRRPFTGSRNGRILQHMKFLQRINGTYNAILSQTSNSKI